MSEKPTPKIVEVRGYWQRRSDGVVELTPEAKELLKRAKENKDAP